MMAASSRETTLRTLFRDMNPNTAQEIREAYYKAVEGLQALADALEAADAKPTDGPPLLRDEHGFACQAIDAMRQSLLGRIL